jgi:pimeloyl-ACP methyl ester carboxylesterase
MKPTLVISGGCWLRPAIYDSIANLLRDAGYEVHVLDHKSNQVSTTFKDGAEPTYADDVAQVRALYTQLIEQQNKEVLLVTHSYGAIPALDASEGFSRKERQSGGGGEGGIVGMVALASLIPKQGKQVLEFVPEMGYLSQTVEVRTLMMIESVSPTPHPRGHAVGSRQVIFALRVPNLT